MSDLTRRFATNLLWVLAAIWAVVLLSYAVVALSWGRVPAPVAAIGASALVIAGYLTYQQSHAEA